MSRVPLLPAEDPRWHADLRHYHDSAGRPLPIFAAVAANERVLLDLRTATKAALTSDLPVRFREIMILRICDRRSCLSEWEAHVDLFARAAGLRSDDLESLHLDHPSFEGDDDLAFRVAEAVVGGSLLSAELWQRLTDRFGTELALDCVAVAGQYLKITWLANALGLNLGWRRDPRPAEGTQQT